MNTIYDTMSTADLLDEYAFLTEKWQDHAAFDEAHPSPIDPAVADVVRQNARHMADVAGARRKVWNVLRRRGVDGFQFDGAVAGLNA